MRSVDRYRVIVEEMTNCNSVPMRKLGKALKSVERYRSIVAEIKDTDSGLPKQL